MHNKDNTVLLSRLWRISSQDRAGQFYIARTLTHPCPSLLRKEGSLKKQIPSLCLAIERVIERSNDRVSKLCYIAVPVVRNKTPRSHWLTPAPLCFAKRGLKKEKANPFRTVVYCSYTSLQICDYHYQ